MHATFKDDTKYNWIQQIQDTFFSLDFIMQTWKNIKSAMLRLEISSVQEMHCIQFKSIYNENKKKNWITIFRKNDVDMKRTDLGEFCNLHILVNYCQTTFGVIKLVQFCEK